MGARTRLTPHEAETSSLHTRGWTSAHKNLHWPHSGWQAHAETSAPHTQGGWRTRKPPAPTLGVAGTRENLRRQRMRSCRSQETPCNHAQRYRHTPLHQQRRLHSLHPDQTSSKLPSLSAGGTHEPASHTPKRGDSSPPPPQDPADEPPSPASQAPNCEVGSPYSWSLKHELPQ